MRSYFVICRSSESTLAISVLEKNIRQHKMRSHKSYQRIFRPITTSKNVSNNSSNQPLRLTRQNHSVIISIHCYRSRYTSLEVKISDAIGQISSLYVRYWGLFSFIYSTTMAFYYIAFIIGFSLFSLYI